MRGVRRTARRRRLPSALTHRPPHRPGSTLDPVYCVRAFATGMHAVRRVYARFDGRVNSLAITARSDGGEVASARLTMPFIEGELAAAPTISPNVVSYSFSSPALTAAIARGRDPFTCASGSSDGDDF